MAATSRSRIVLLRVDLVVFMRLSFVVFIMDVWATPSMISCNCAPKSMIFATCIFSLCWGLTHRVRWDVSSIDESVYKHCYGFCSDMMFHVLKSFWKGDHRFGLMRWICALRLWESDQTKSWNAGQCDNQIIVLYISVLNLEMLS